MASGTFSTVFGTYYRLQMDWTATQSTANNSSTVSTKLYLVSTSSRANIGSSASKRFSITIDGTTSSTTGNLNLSGGQKKLLHSYSKAVSHDSNGTKSVGISGFMQFGVNVNGHTADVTTSKTVAMPKISSAATASTIDNVSAWRAGETFSVSINRTSTAHTHTIRVYVGSALVATRTGIGSSAVISFNTPELTSIFNEVGSWESAAASVQLDTYSGSTKIGSTDTTNFRIAAGLPTDHVNFPSGKSFQAGSPVRFTLVPNNDRFYHTVILRYGGTEVARTEMSPGETSGTISTASSKTQINNYIGSASSANFTVQVYTKWVNQQIRQPIDFAIKMTPDKVAQKPTFNATLSLYDSNYTTRVAVGRANTFVNGQSILEITVPSSQKATAQGSASIVRYTFSVGDRTVTRSDTPGSIVASIPNITGEENETVTVTATDSNGVDVSVYASATFISYQAPVIVASAERVGRFETDTVLTSYVFIKNVRVGSVDKNSLISYKYRYRQSNGSWGGWINVTTFMPKFEVTLQLDNSKSWEVEVSATDKFQEDSYIIKVSAGKPTLFVDAMKNSVGVNMFPTVANSLEIDGQVRASENSSIGSVKIGKFGTDITRSSNGDIDVGGNSNTVTLFGGSINFEKYYGYVQLSTSTGTFRFKQKIEANGGLTVGGSSALGATTFSTQPFTSSKESGYCGLQTEAVSPFGLGYGVNFKMSKDYTPSTISLSVSSGNLSTASVYTGYITEHGFWFQILRKDASTNTAWRGTYTA